MDQGTPLCEGCGDALTPMKRAGNPKRYCSERCRVKIYRRDNPEMVARKNEAAKLRARARAAERDAVDPRPRCKNCGVELVSRRAGRSYCNAPACQSVAKTEGRKLNSPCSVDECGRPVIARGYCGGHYKSEYHTPKFGASNRRPKARTCPCGEVVYSVQAKQKYCSEDCRSAWRGAEQARGRELVRWVRPLERVALHETRAPRRWTAGECAHCGALFVRRGTGAVYCSEVCGKRAAWTRFYRRHGDFSIPPRGRLAIYERDQWVCQLCGEQTSKVYSSNDPLSPTLDHIVPRSLHLVPDDSPSNLRLACALCNATRGNDVNWIPEAVAS